MLAGGEPQHRVLETGLNEIVLERALILEILLGLATRDLVERRLRDEEMPVIDEPWHLPIEKGEQQRADMGAVDVGVRHDDDLVVAQLLDVELVAPDARA